MSGLQKCCDKSAMCLVISGVLALGLSVAGCSDGDEWPPLYNDWEITEPTPLLTSDGTLAAWGWARHPYLQYDRERVLAADQERIKEWDYYSIMTPDYHLDITLANISWLVLATVNYTDFNTGDATHNLFIDGNPAALDLPPDPYDSITFGEGDNMLSFQVTPTGRTIGFSFPQSDLFGPAFSGEVHIEDNPAGESLVTAMPFAEPGRFFYTDKIFALPASGTFEIEDQSFVIPAGESWAVLDWGRGVWPEEFEWGWAGAGGLVDGVRFGFNIGFGDEDNSRTTGSAVLYDGVLHKLGEIEWQYNADDLMQPWQFTSLDGRFEMTLDPAADGSMVLDLGTYRANTTKVYGHCTGEVVLDDGTALTVSDILCFAEHCIQAW
jgi:hypothetical protein